jgi:hypothetical protein
MIKSQQQQQVAAMNQLQVISQQQMDRDVAITRGEVVAMIKSEVLAFSQQDDQDIFHKDIKAI